MLLAFPFYQRPHYSGSQNAIRDIQGWHAGRNFFRPRLYNLSADDPSG
jgi:hypothetical protein